MMWKILIFINTLGTGTVINVYVNFKKLTQQ